MPFRGPCSPAALRLLRPWATRGNAPNGKQGLPLESLARYLFSSVYSCTIFFLSSNSLPDIFLGILPTPHQKSNGPSLREGNCLTLPRVMTEIMKKSISYKGSVLWNNLHNETKVIENSKHFSKALTNEELRDSMF
jgi:hypothetical protein